VPSLLGSLARVLLAVPAPFALVGLALPWSPIGSLRCGMASVRIVKVRQLARFRRTRRGSSRRGEVP